MRGKSPRRGKKEHLKPLSRESSMQRNEKTRQQEVFSGEMAVGFILYL
jgi:hypothetical protein